MEIKNTRKILIAHKHKYELELEITVILIKAHNSNGKIYYQ